MFGLGSHMNRVFYGYTYSVYPSLIVLLLCAKVKIGFSLQPCVLSLLCVVIESPTSLPHSLHGIIARETEARGDRETLVRGSTSPFS